MTQRTRTSSAGPVRRLSGQSRPIRRRAGSSRTCGASLDPAARSSARRTRLRADSTTFAGPSTEGGGFEESVLEPHELPVLDGKGASCLFRHPSGRGRDGVAHDRPSQLESRQPGARRASASLSPTTCVRRSRVIDGFRSRCSRLRPINFPRRGRTSATAACLRSPSRNLIGNAFKFTASAGQCTGRDRLTGRSGEGLLRETIGRGLRPYRLREQAVGVFPRLHPAPSSRDAGWASPGAAESPPPRGTRLGDARVNEGPRSISPSMKTSASTSAISGPVPQRTTTGF